MGIVIKSSDQDPVILKITGHEPDDSGKRPAQEMGNATIRGITSEPT